jgi:hypothetical protein
MFRVAQLRRELDPSMPKSSSSTDPAKRTTAGESVDSPKLGGKPPGAKSRVAGGAAFRGADS